MKKTIAILRWVLYGVLIPLILTLLSYIIFPISYLIREKLRDMYYGEGFRKIEGFYKVISIPLWIFLDDEEYWKQGNDFGEPWWREAKGLKTDTSWRRFKTAYLWSVVRNPAWNMYYLIHPRYGEIYPIEFEGYLVKEGFPQEPTEMAVLKYEDENGNFKDNKGDFLSWRYSILGKMKLWYMVGGRIYWRYSRAGYSKFIKRWIEIQLGTNDRRYTIRFKIKKTKLSNDFEI